MFEFLKYFEFLKDIFDRYILNQFHKVRTLLITLFIVFLLLLHFRVFLGEDFHHEKILYGTVIGSIIIFWLFHRYRPYPKNKIDRKSKQRKTGLVVSIYSDDYASVRVKNKFIRELYRCIIDADLDKYFKIISIQNHKAEKIRTKEDIDNLHKKVKGHIYFYGDIQKEKDGNVKKYFLNIDGYVKHLPIPIPISIKLSHDFRTVLPKEINFSELFELRGCKATAQIVYLTVRYIVGIASSLSGNPFFAFKMHKDLMKELDKYRRINQDKKLNKLTKFDFKELKKIKNKLPLMISDEAVAISKIYFENNKINEAKSFLDTAFKNNPNNYGAFLLKTVFDFLFDNNPKEAFRSIKKAKKYAKGRVEWRYSWAFLKFWFGEYSEAYKMCQKINQQTHIGEEIDLKEVEDFNLNILKRDNSKPQLYFWIGYLSYKKRKHLPNALKYFEKFIDLANQDTMNFLIERANTFLQEIKKEMEISN